MQDLNNKQKIGFNLDRVEHDPKIEFSRKIKNIAVPKFCINYVEVKKKNILESSRAEP